VAVLAPPHAIYGGKTGYL